VSFTVAMRFLNCAIFSLVLSSAFAQKMTDQSLQKINSVFDELNPVMSPDGTTIYFTTANHPDNIAGKRDPGDVWFSRWDGQQWTPPRHAGPAINDRTYNAVAGFSRDGNRIFLLNHFDASGNSAKTQGISICTATSGGWSKAENIYIPYFQNKSRLLSGSMSADNQVFIFSAETYGTLGVDDIYVSVLENGKWSEPKNLGPSINTQFQELSPSLSDDGKTLYFSSNGRKGMGSFDVFSSTRLDDSWTNWSEPVNLGGNINSEGRELFYHELPNLGFSLFTSTKNSDGYGDLRLHPMDDSLKNTSPVAPVVVQQTDTTTLVSAPVKPAEQSLPDIVRVYGVVKNSKNGEQLEAQVTFEGPKLSEKVTTPATTNGYSIRVPSAGSYSIKIEAPGYISSLEKIDIHTYEMGELEMNFVLQPVEIGATVNLKNVLFAQAKTDLLPESFDELDLVVSFLKTNPHVKIELSGHTDNRGVQEDNVRLSQQRVNAVKSYLVSKGIDAKRITGKGYGGSHPIASNDSEETRRMNRRVEFTIRKSK
jgi:OOP family OmpA-OmpF porin